MYRLLSLHHIGELLAFVLPIKNEKKVVGFFSPFFFLFLFSLPLPCHSERGRKYNNKKKNLLVLLLDGKLRFVCRSKSKDAHIPHTRVIFLFSSTFLLIFFYVKF